MSPPTMLDTTTPLKWSNECTVRCFSNALQIWMFDNLPHKLEAHSEQTQDAHDENIKDFISSQVSDSLYSESVAAKLWNVASKVMTSNEPPLLYPEYTGDDRRNYIYRNLDFWTSGFFPGSLYLLLERQIRYPHYYRGSIHSLQLEYLCHWWTTNLHQNASRCDTHDLGFMIAPWATKAWELEGDPRAYSTLVVAAHSLARRFDPRVQSLRSWDGCATKTYSFDDTSKDFLVIVDNMMNLDMLFWVAAKTKNKSLYDIAVAHARTTQRNHIRTDYTTVHVVNYDQEKGTPKSKFTHQGYSDNSCWARGQAWAILGFMQTFEWTGDKSFLTTARKLADVFVAQLPQDGVPYWDFDAPVNPKCPRDTSAGMIAACGMLLIYKALKNVERDTAMSYLRSTRRILEGTCSKFLTTTAEFTTAPSPTPLLTFPESLPDAAGNQPGPLGLKENEDITETILDGATINNYEFAPRQWADHGLVYADYYFMLLGNMMLEMGLVSPALH